MKLNSELIALHSRRLVLGNECKRLRERKNSLVTKVKIRDDALRRYGATTEACKPIILEAIEAKWLAEFNNGSDDVSRAQAIEKTMAEYKEKFEVLEIDLSK